MVVNVRKMAAEGGGGGGTGGQAGGSKKGNNKTVIEGLARAGRETKMPKNWKLPARGLPRPPAVLPRYPAAAASSFVWCAPKPPLRTRNNRLPTAEPTSRPLNTHYIHSNLPYWPSAPYLLRTARSATWWLACELGSFSSQRPENDQYKTNQTALLANGPSGTTRKRLGSRLYMRRLGFVAHASSRHSARHKGAGRKQQRSGAEGTDGVETRLLGGGIRFHGNAAIQSVNPWPFPTLSRPLPSPFSLCPHFPSLGLLPPAFIYPPSHLGTLSCGNLPSGALDRPHERL